MRTRLSILVSLMVFASGWSAPAWSTYSSKEELFNRFQQASVDEIIRIDVDEGILWHRFKPNGEVESEKFSKKNTNLEIVSVPYLDYYHGQYYPIYANPKKLEIGIKKKMTTAYAYKVGEVFLCYSQTISNTLTGARIENMNFNECYMFPRAIDDVLATIKEAN